MQIVKNILRPHHTLELEIKDIIEKVRDSNIEGWLAPSEADTIKVECDPSRMRPSDVQILLCDGAKFRGKTGWIPSIPFKQTLEDLLVYWRRVVS